MSVKAHELAIKLTFISEPVKSVWTSASKYTGGQYGVLASPKAEYSSFEPINEFIFFLEVNTYLLLEVCGVSFYCFRRPSSGSV